MKNRFDKMLLGSNSTIGDIQTGFMKLIPMYSMRRSKSASINDGLAKNEKTTSRSTNQRDRSRSLELESVPNNKNRSKRRSRSNNNSVKVVNRSQAKTMSSLKALRGGNMPKSSMSLSPSSSNGARSYSNSSDNSLPPSPYLEEDILPYTLTVDVSEYHVENSHIHRSGHHTLLEKRKVRFDWLLALGVSDWMGAIYIPIRAGTSHGWCNGARHIQSTNLTFLC